MTLAKFSSGHMAERKTYGYTLAEAVIVCPECQIAFAKEVLVDTPPITSEDTIEADLHRVFPSPELRAALLALCPNCKYCTWTGMFQGHNVNPALVQKEPQLDPTKKYALAVKCARAKNLHALDIAFVALNGLWCAREANEPDQLWLELVAYEHGRGMPENSPRPDEDGLTHLLMAEIWRQLGQFEKAIAEYDQCHVDPSVLPSIVHHQTNLAKRGIASPTALPLHVVKQLFEVLEMTDAAESAPVVQQSAAAEAADEASTHMFSAMATMLAAAAEFVDNERDTIQQAPAQAKPAIASSSAAAPSASAALSSASAQVAAAAPVAPAAQSVVKVEQPAQAPVKAPAAQNAIAPQVVQAAAPVAQKSSKPKEEVQPAKVAKQEKPVLPEIKKVQTKHGPLVASLEQTKSQHMKRYRPSQGQEVTASGWVTDYNPAATPTAPDPAPGADEDYYDDYDRSGVTTPVIGPNPNAVPPASSNPYGSMGANPYADAMGPLHHSPSDYDSRGADVYGQPDDPFLVPDGFSENPNRTEALPDIDIDDPFGELAARKRAVPVQPAEQPQAPPAQPQQPAQQPAAAQNNASDAIARVESYLSFSRALHTRSWMRGMGN